MTGFRVGYAHRCEYQNRTVCPYKKSHVAYDYPVYRTQSYARPNNHHCREKLTRVCFQVKKTATSRGFPLFFHGRRTFQVVFGISDLFATPLFLRNKDFSAKIINSLGTSLQKNKTACIDLQIRILQVFASRYITRNLFQRQYIRMYWNFFGCLEPIYRS